MNTAELSGKLNRLESEGERLKMNDLQKSLASKCPECGCEVAYTDDGQFVCSECGWTYLEKQGGDYESNAGSGGDD